jgi:MYXO-CTERM domain-containing protein
MRNKSLLGLVLIPVLTACGPEGSGTSTELGKAASAVQDGTSDTSSAHNFAVGIYNPQYGAVCSGSLIAPNLVLTARHCVVPPAEEAVSCNDKFPSQNVSPSSLYVTTSPRMDGSANNYHQATAIDTPTDTAFCGNDIALITLGDNIPSSEAQPVTPVVQFKMTDTTKVGTLITAIGYGITSPNGQDSGIRRIHQDIGIVCVPGAKNTSCDSSYKSAMSDNEFVTQGFVCSGDSGSGAFDQESFAKGKPYVMGALSRGPQSADQCLAAIYSRTDVHADLIIATAKKAAKSGNYAAPEWTVTAAQAETPTPSKTTDPSSSDDSTSDSSPTEPADDSASDSVPTVTTTTTKGCSAAPSGRSDGFSALALAGVVSLVAGRRRRKTV